MLPALSLSSPPSSTAVKVDKATSELLLGPDWTMNMEICDAINSDHWLAKDVVKAVKKRLQHKNPTVQLLTLTLLETMVKNCGDYIHFHIAEKKILDEMIKIVRKRSDMQVRDKVLVLLDSWQEAFGGPGGKHSQYYWAYDELRRSGVQFPLRSLDSAPIFTPPVTQPLNRHAQASVGMPINASRRLDEAMASEVESLSTSSIESMRNVMDLLADMLQAVDPKNRMAVKDEVIIDLVDRCRANQKKLMQMLTTTADEGLLALGLELNDALQCALAKHDAIASGTPLLTQGTTLSPQASEAEAKLTKAEGKRQTLTESPIPAAPMVRDQVDEEEEDDEFAQLARRHAKPHPMHSKDMSIGTDDEVASSSNDISTAAPDSASSNALVLLDPPAPTKTTKEQEMIDLLSIVLSTTSTSPEAPQTPKFSPPRSQTPVSPGAQGDYAPQSYALNPTQVPFNSYVVPWAQPQPQHQFPSQPQPLQPQPGHPQYSSRYPPPPWAAASGYGNNQNSGFTDQYAYSTPQPIMNRPTMQGVQSWQQVSSFQNPHSKSPNVQSPVQATMNASPAPAQGVRSLQHTNSFQNPHFVTQPLNSTAQPMNSASRPMQGIKSLQHMNSFPTRGSNGITMSGDSRATAASVGNPGSQKPFIPSYRLFEDLNVFGSAENKLRSGPYPSSSGNPSPSMVGGRG
ncbi:hypothetical protein Nepgr_011840 [Nepenthes gracilis]|uniref:Uncharacterized protein n=1 Tax=Nepenthes gracilis TaxID=150966 RepID=A0AAD3SFU0_NEPGR|nr:hypothetical protein Nepgr_011840 [Nepenthes gracilis]